MNNSVFAALLFTVIFGLIALYADRHRAPKDEIKPPKKRE